MRGVSSKVVVGLVLVAGVSVTASGCAENESTLFIIGAATLDSDCKFAPSVSTALLPAGRYDVGFDGSYQVNLILANQMAARGTKAQSRTETSRIVLEGAEVSLVTPEGALYALPSNPNPFTAPGAGFVNVGSGSDPGYGGLSVVVIPRQEGVAEKQALIEAGYLIAEIKAFGHTLGGQAVESNVFRFPIEVCFKCLVTYPPSELSPLTGTCGITSSAESTSAPCSWGQDTAVVCSTCAANFNVCQYPTAGLADI